ncbi:MAG: hypothetical protein ACI3XA_08165 [Clostridia bacterium]
MNEDFVYIMYPVKIEKLKEMGLPFLTPKEQKPPVEIVDEENFMPLWYGTARFPEDDI